MLLLLVLVLALFVFRFVVARETLSATDAGEAQGSGNGPVGNVVLTVAVPVDAVEAGRCDGGDVAAFEDAGRSTHAVPLSDAAGTGCRSRNLLGAAGSDGERECMSAATHVGFAESPMHSFTRAPGHAELVRDGVPEFGLESARNISWLVHRVVRIANFCLPDGRFWRRENDHTDRRLSQACCVAPRPSQLASRGSFGSVIGS